jgi:dTDP-4-dehydrorhamnose reductase
MNKKRVLLLGSTGMAGHMIYFYLKSIMNYEMTNVAYRTKLRENTIILDINDKEKTNTLIIQNKPDIIINCVGILIKESKKHPDNAIYVNAYFPHFLKRCADEIGAKLVHISTDCVFSGKRGSYTDNDFRDADDIYGRSKALGEIINEKDLTLRTSIIGPELKKNGEGLFHWFMTQTGEINGYINSIWGGITTLELAKAMDIAIKQEKTGLIQLSNDIPISKYDLLKLFKEIWQKDDIIINPFEGNLLDKSIMKSNCFDYIIPNYRDMLIEQYDWMKKNKYIYEKIYL